MLVRCARARDGCRICRPNSPADSSVARDWAAVGAGATCATGRHEWVEGPARGGRLSVCRVCRVTVRTVAAQPGKHEYCLLVD